MNAILNVLFSVAVCLARDAEDKIEFDLSLGWDGEAQETQAKLVNS